MYGLYKLYWDQERSNPLYYQCRYIYIYMIIIIIINKHILMHFDLLYTAVIHVYSSHFDNFS